MNFPLLLQATDPRWYEEPTTIAAFAALVGVLLAPFINSWIQNRNQRRKQLDHVTDTSLSINRDERKEAVEMMKAAHARDVAHFQRQLREQDLRTDRLVLDAKVREYEARQRAHMYGNECNRVVSGLYRLEALLVQHGIEAPAFVYKTYPDIMDGLDEMVATFKKDLEEEFARRRREEDEFEASGERPVAG